MYETSKYGIALLPRRGRGGWAASLFRRLPANWAVIALCLVVSAGPASAIDKGKLILKITTEKEVVVKDEKGMVTIKRVDLTKVNAVPGDEVIVTLDYRNTGKTKADGVVIDYPIPEKMLYKELSAEGAGTIITFSVDKGKTYDRPEKLTVKNSEGKVVPARPVDYTHIRWAFSGSVDAGKIGKVGFRTFVK